MKKIVIIGAGYQAECVIANILEENSFEIVGLLDHQKTGELMGFPILGNDDHLSVLKAKGVEYAFPGAVIGAKADTSVVERVMGTIAAAGFKVPNLISSRALVRQGVKLGKGILIQPFAMVDVGCVLGDGITVNPHVLVGHHCRIEDHVVFAGGAVLNARLTMGRGAFIGMGAKVFADVGSHSKVAPGAVILEKVPDNHIAFGNPARIMPRIKGL